jgi:hypothetical protein
VRSRTLKSVVVRLRSIARMSVDGRRFVWAASVPNFASKPIAHTDTLEPARCGAPGFANDING